MCYLGFSEEKSDHFQNEFRQIKSCDIPISKEYLSRGGISFDTCDLTEGVCKRCYLDFHKNKHKAGTPYWARVHSRLQKDRKSCSICLTVDSSKWSPVGWIKGTVKNLVNTFFCEELEGRQLDEYDNLCNTHYKDIYNLWYKTPCTICKSKLTDATEVVLIGQNVNTLSVM